MEKKFTLSGRMYSFRCELLQLDSGLGVLKYIMDQEYRINGLTLHPGDITFALYWRDRPYTLYVWYLNGNRCIYYFNIADSISLQPNEFIWRDLVVDVLIDADQGVHVLDEDELPADISPQLLFFIQTAKNLILGNYRSIVEEARAVLQTLA